MIKNIILRYLTFITGLYFLSLGIVLIVASSLGTTPISSVNYVVTLHTPITLGTATFLINVLLIAGQFWLIRSGHGTRKDRIEILLQLPFSLVFSIFIDINMAFIGSVEPTSYPMALAMLGAGCLSQVCEICRPALQQRFRTPESYLRRCPRQLGPAARHCLFGPYRGGSRRHRYSSPVDRFHRLVSLAPRFHPRRPPASPLPPLLTCDSLSA